MAALSDDLLRILFSQLCNVLDPGAAVAFSSACSELRELTQAERQQLQAENEAAAALCRKLGYWNCKELREVKTVDAFGRGLTAEELKLLGSLGSVLPALERLWLSCEAGVYGMQELAAGLGAGALRALTELSIRQAHVGDAGASALAAALEQGALPRLKTLDLYETAIGDAGLVALAPALQWRPALEYLCLERNPLGDVGLTALVAPPHPPPTTGGLPKLKELALCYTQITDAGCATLAAALDRGALPALKLLHLGETPASAAATAAVYVSMNWRSRVI